MANVAVSVPCPCDFHSTNLTSLQLKTTMTVEDALVERRIGLW